MNNVDVVTVLDPDAIYASVDDATAIQVNCILKATDNAYVINVNFASHSNPVPVSQ